MSKMQTEYDPSVTTLVSGIVSDVQTLISQQFQLLKNEVRDDFRKTRSASLLCAIGAGLTGLTAILVALMSVYLLSWAYPELPLWSCFAICAGGVAILAIAIVWAGVAKFKSFNPLPDETANALKENLQWIQNPK